MIHRTSVEGAVAVIVGWGLVYELFSKPFFYVRTLLWQRRGGGGEGRGGRSRNRECDLGLFLFFLFLLVFFSLFFSSPLLYSFVFRFFVSRTYFFMGFLLDSSFLLLLFRVRFGNRRLWMARGKIVRVFWGRGGGGRGGRQQRHFFSVFFFCFFFPSFVLSSGQVCLFAVRRARWRDDENPKKKQMESVNPSA